MQSFLTGSRMYGTPSEESDIDMVVLLRQDEIDDLIKLSDLGKMPLRFGNLNIIAIKSLCEYRKWEESFWECMKKKPVTRSEAIAIHKACGIDFEDASKTKAQLIAEGIL